MFLCQGSSEGFSLIATEQIESPVPPDTSGCLLIQSTELFPAFKICRAHGTNFIFSVREDEVRDWCGAKN